MEYSSVDLSWLPSDADEQLALGFRIISNAYKTRVTTLEAEIRSARAVAAEKADHLTAMQKKYSSLEVQLIESTQRGNQLAEENRNLVATIKKLQRDIDRLESLKKAVLCSIQDDHGDTDTDRRYYTTEDMLHSAAPRTMLEINGGDQGDGAFLRKVHLKGGPVITCTNTTATPSTLSALGIEKETIDGRQFFKVAKARLNHEDFASFISLVKKFNAQIHSKEETLIQARKILGESNQAMYEEFRQLLTSRN